MAAKLQNMYVLGEFELDPDRYRLKRNNEHIHLAELPFQVLLYLVEQRDRYVSRLELLEHFWAGSESYEETLTRCISTIRTQLNDPPTTPRFIETRKKVGYRYIGPCEVLAGSFSATEGTLEVETTRVLSVIIDEQQDEPKHILAPVRSSQRVTLEEIARPLLPAPSSRSMRKAMVATFVVMVFLAAGLMFYLRQRSSTAGPSGRINSIAVLPLRNMSGDSANDYFSDGMTESLITSLSKVNGLKVVSRSSVFRFKNKDVDLRKVGNQLGVDAVLEGSVRKLGESVRVALRLVSVDDGRVLWVSDSNDRALGDIFALQDEIARNVAVGLKLRVSGDTKQLLARRYTDNIEAYEFYLQGRFYLNNYVNREDLLKSIQYFEAAIAKDSNYALAHAGLSDSYLMLSTDWQTPRESAPKAQEHALKALELDESLGEAHFSQGAIAYFYEWDWATAKKELERAFELNAKTLEGNSCYLHSLDSSGNPDVALIHVRRALDQNPLSISISGELGCASYYARRYDQAIDFSRETLKMEQGYVFARYNAARALGQKQMHEQAIAELKKAMELWGRSAVVLSELGYNYAVSGRKAEARKLLDELKRRSAHEYIDAYPVAFIYVGLGEQEEALRSLQKAYEARSTWMPWLRVEPKFDSLRSDPRFIDLLKRLKFDS
ncbi:MAG: TPR end-of-group domain-containing protein [Pyrinomonadaceae bacterium]